MSDLTKFLIQSYVRKALTMLGTFLITHDVIAPGTQNDFATTYLDEAVGFVLLAGSTAWSTLYQNYVKWKIKKALALKAGSTSKDLEKAMENGVATT